MRTWMPTVVVMVIMIALPQIHGKNTQVSDVSEQLYRDVLSNLLGSRKAADENVATVQACNPPCQNGGVCFAGKKCICTPYFYGGHCQQGTVPFYRYYNKREHFYTTNVLEIGTVTPGQVGKHGFRSEGYQCRIYKTHVPHSVPLHRYWNGIDHFYTTNPYEIGTTTPGSVGKHKYRYEGVAGYCFHHKSSKKDGNVPLHRSFSGKEHFYTTHKVEITKARFSYEGVACYVGER